MSDALKNWIRENGLSVPEFAQRIGKPYPTVKKWVYKDRMPSKESLPLVYNLTGLDEFKPEPEMTGHPGITGAKLSRDLGPNTARMRQPVEVLIRDLVNHIRMTEEIIRFFANAPLDIREMLRSRLDPKGIAYFSGLLRAMLSEERLREFEIATDVSTALRPGEGGGQHGTGS